eukprot:jgi/Picsp_1/1189/NSC_04670-R1_hypothetical protein COCSUDRAFT_67088 [Coccomyxa subellipsoidea C-169]
MHFSPLKANAPLLLTRDQQINELRSVYDCSRVIAGDIDSVEVPFESSKGSGSILLSLPLGFPRLAPEVSILWDEAGFRSGASVCSPTTRSPVRTDFQWGQPGVRLVSIVSNLWHRLGCVESPRKAAFRTCSPELTQATVTRLTPGDTPTRIGSDSPPRPLKMSPTGRLSFVVGDNDICAINVSPTRNHRAGQESGQEEEQRPPGVPLSWVQKYVATLNDEEVESAVQNSSHFERILSGIGVAGGGLVGLQRSWQASDLRQKNIQLAKDNVKKSTERQNLKQQLAILESEYNERVKQYSKLHRRQENARSGFAPETLVGNLGRSAKEFEQRAEQALKEWQRNSINASDFVGQYFSARANYHARSNKYKLALESIPISMPSLPSHDNQQT